MNKGKSCSGRANLAWVLGLGSVVLAVVLVALLRPFPRQQVSPGGKGTLLVWVAASQRAPMEQAARAYEQRSGCRVELSLGGSQSLLANLEISKKGDLYIPADDSYLAPARAKGLIDQTFPLARMTACLAVPKGNPKQLHTLADLKAPGVKLAQANPDSAAIGKLVRQALKLSNDWAVLEARTTVFKPNVNDVANDVKLGSVDAGFIWDAMGPQYPELELARLPEIAAVRASVAVAVVRHSSQPDEALRFARWLADPEQGLKIWRQHGYEVSPFPPK